MKCSGFDRLQRAIDTLKETHPRPEQVEEVWQMAAAFRQHIQWVLDTHHVEEDLRNDIVGSWNSATDELQNPRRKIDD